MKWSSSASTGRESSRSPWFLMLLTVAVIGAGASLLSPYARHQWALSLFRQPTRYTALSFNQAWTLPTKVAVNDPVPISFTIENQEGRALNYRYVLREAGPASPASVMKSATKRVADGAAWTVSLVVHAGCSVSPCRIEVTLPGHPEMIYFLVSLTEAKGQQPGRKRHVRSS